MDDLSQHASKPVYDGEKWLMNLWVWGKCKLFSFQDIIHEKIESPNIKN